MLPQNFMTPSMYQHTLQFLAKAQLKRTSGLCIVSHYCSDIMWTLPIQTHWERFLCVSACHPESLWYIRYSVRCLKGAHKDLASPSSVKNVIFLVYVSGIFIFNKYSVYRTFFSLTSFLLSLGQFTLLSPIQHPSIHGPSIAYSFVIHACMYVYIHHPSIHGSSITYSFVIRACMHVYIHHLSMQLSITSHSSIYSLFTPHPWMHLSIFYPPAIHFHMPLWAL